MTNGFRLPSPGGYQQAYSESYRLAFDQLAQSDLNRVCARSGAVRIGEESLGVGFLGVEIVVDIPRRTVSSGSNGLPITDQLVVLHYLITADGKVPSGHLISFKELPEGSVYYPTFYKRAIAPILRHFGDSPRELADAAAVLGGEAIALGDIAIAIQPLPRVKLIWVLWRGDADFPAEGAVLFDSTIDDYLPVEDIAVLCQSIAMKLTEKQSALGMDSQPGRGL
jgi:hypothetical protein